MVSALWNACSAGDVDAVRDILNDANPVDIELKGSFKSSQAPQTNPHLMPIDHFGVTPLIEAVRNAHIDVVRALLDKGADPSNASSQGLPESYTSDPSIIELLRYRASSRFPQDASEDPSKQQYGTPPPAGYPYYPPAPAEGGAYFPTPPNGTENTNPGGVGHLPPPDIARFIPCRYFPACRYGASCMFAHPQQYFPGSLPPPATYVAPYEPMNVQHYPPNYFPPPPFQPNGVHPMTPPPHPAHGPSPSEVGMPVQPPFSPNGLPPAPYGPMSPNAYPHSGQTPVPMMMSSLSPPHHQAAPPAPMYNNAPSSAPAYVPHDGSAPYPVPIAGKPQEFIGDVKPLNPLETPGPNNHHPIRDGSVHRRGGGRRPSFNSSGRRPPCLFFPSGRCKNGDDCRYPHISPEANAPQHMPYYSGRGTRPPRQPHVNGNGIAHLNEKLAGLSVRDDAPAQRNSTDASTNRPHSSEAGRPRFNQGSKNGYNNHQNGARSEKRPPPFKQQRVPNADEFPVLAGFITPPTRTTGLNGLANGNGHAGPTAAQILSAPAPVRKDASSKDSSTRGASPEPIKSAAPKAEPNGVTTESVPTTTTQDHPPAVKLPISFAAVAAPELPKEIALSA
ncbi:hypothetical protein DXG01_011896 [Tephrocybe rancida]|nr:hypothetical protein DXG01_011896 [Tephrocybe rancida]